MIDDFIMGLAVAIFGGVLALMGLPSRFRTRLPSLPEQKPHKTSRAIRTVFSILAVTIGLPVAFAGLVMVWAALAGVQINLPWLPVLTAS
jgi:hypothetical protein